MDANCGGSGSGGLTATLKRRSDDVTQRNDRAKRSSPTADMAEIGN